ncbi:MAG: flavin reductase family protein, partial [Elusimicrobia bacterium]|nr:flavin reductase family protein [Elusimicrobiota bacterium]
PRRYSHDGIDFHKEFVVNYPSPEQAKGAMLCGTKSGRDMDKIKEGGFKLVPSLIVKTPTIENSLLALECKVVSQFSTGDHTVFVGEVLAASGCPEKEKHLFVATDYRPFGIDKDGKVEIKP